MKKYDIMIKTYEDQELNKNEKLIYNYLILLHNEKLGYAYPSYVSLKKALGVVKDDPVSKTIKSLEAKKYIRRIKEAGKNTKYFLLKHIESTTTKSEGTIIFDSTNDFDSTTTPQTESTPQTKGTPQIKSTSTPQTRGGVLPKRGDNRINIELNNRININDQLDQLWSIYPKKRGKAKAYKKLPALIKKYTFEQMKRCIERYIQEIDKNKIDIQYVKQGDTFFNGGYEDYLDENYEDSQETKPEVQEVRIIDFKIGE